jgi:hypothetical protein
MAARRLTPATVGFSLVLVTTTWLTACTGPTGSGHQQAVQRSVQPASASAASPTPIGLPIRYLVAPHPDDEFAIWSMEQDTSHYPVLVVLTTGERAAACSGLGLQTAAGERRPSPQPFTGKLTANCSAERIDSLLAFLRGMAAVDPRWAHLRNLGDHPAGSSSPGCTEDFGCNGFDLWRGAGAALLLFQLGDGDVTPAKVSWAVQAARAARSMLPTQHEDDIVGMGYHNTGDPTFMIYDQPDQLAVSTVLTTIDLGLPGAQYSRTYPADPAAAVTRVVDPSVFTFATKVSPGPDDPTLNPAAQRIGPLQVDYGWLAFPDPYWYAEPEPIHSFYSSSQDFTKAF